MSSQVKMRRFGPAATRGRPAGLGLDGAVRSVTPGAIVYNCRCLLSQGRVLCPECVRHTWTTQCRWRRWTGDVRDFPCGHWHPCGVYSQRQHACRIGFLAVPAALHQELQGGSLPPGGLGGAHMHARAGTTPLKWTSRNVSPRQADLRMR